MTSGGVSRSGRQKINSGQVTGIDQLELLTIKIAEAKFDWKNEEIQNSAKKDLEEIIRLYDSWRLEFPCCTRYTLLDMQVIVSINIIVYVIANIRVTVIIFALALALELVLVFALLLL